MPPCGDKLKLVTIGVLPTLKEALPSPCGDKLKQGYKFSRTCYDVLPSPCGDKLKLAYWLDKAYTHLVTVPLRG